LGWSAAAALLCLGRVDWGLLYDQAVRFNFSVYARYCGFGSPGYLLSGLDFGGPSQYFESLLKLAVWAWVGWQALGRKYGRALWWLAFVLCLTARREPVSQAVPFHSAGFFLVATLLFCRELSSAWLKTAGRRGPRWALGLAAAALLAPTWLASAALVRPERLYPHGDPDYGAVLAAISRLTGPAERIAVFPMASRVYLESDRLPAVPNTCYLPWQSDWPSQRAATLSALRSVPPAVVVLQRGPVWGVPWSSYARDIDDWLAQAYRPVLLPGKKAEEPYSRLYLRKGR
jgi:hypothetical protein